MNHSAIESSAHPGYYLIPGYSSYVVSPEGAVFNSRRGEFVGGSTNPDGYHNFRLQADDGNTLTWGRHRLLGFVFKNPGQPVQDLVINHDNGIKGDDRLSNLEWTTYRGNAEHAGANGLTEKCIPMSTRNAATGETRDYPSMIACAQAMGLSKDAVAYRCSIGDTRVFPEGYQYRTGASAAPWFIPQDVQTALLQNSTSKAVLVRDVRTGQVSQFPQQGALAAQLGVSLATVSTWLSRSDQPIVAHGIQVKLATDTAPWRNPIDIAEEMASYGGRRRILVTHAESGQTQVFASAKECAMAQGLKTTTLAERLKAGGAKVHKDGYSYQYA